MIESEQFFILFKKKKKSVFAHAQQYHRLMEFYNFLLYPNYLRSIILYQIIFLIKKVISKFINFVVYKQRFGSFDFDIGKIIYFLQYFQYFFKKR